MSSGFMIFGEFKSVIKYIFRETRGKLYGFVAAEFIGREAAKLEIRGKCLRWG